MSGKVYVRFRALIPLEPRCGNCRSRHQACVQCVPKNDRQWDDWLHTYSLADISPPVRSRYFLTTSHVNDDGSLIAPIAMGSVVDVL